MLWSVSASQWVDRHLSNLIRKALKRYTMLKIHDFAKLLHLAGDYQITELLVTADDWLSGHSLAELVQRKEGVMVLGITREDGRFIGAPGGDTHLRTGDVLILYGRAKVIGELDQREPGFVGNMAHQQNISEQAWLDREEREKDREPSDAGPS